MWIRDRLFGDAIIRANLETNKQTNPEKTSLTQCLRPAADQPISSQLVSGVGHIGNYLSILDQSYHILFIELVLSWNSAPVAEPLNRSMFNNSTPLSPFGHERSHSCLIPQATTGRLWNNLSSFCCFSLMTFTCLTLSIIVFLLLILDSLLSSNSLASTFAYSDLLTGKHSLRCRPLTPFVLFAPPAIFIPCLTFLDQIHP